MKKDSYSLEYLVNKFSEHSIETKKVQKEGLHAFIENNQNQPVPEYFLDDFCFPEALEIICRELISLKKDRK